MPAGGQLPPDHPEIGPAAGGTAASAPAPVSPEAQAAADAADKSPRDFAAQFKAAETFYRLRDYRKAEQYGARAAELRPRDFKTHVLLGNSRYDRKDFTGAAEAYERALSINADDPDVRTDYGNTFFLRQPPDLDRAIAEYRKSLAASPRHEQSWMNLASASVQKKDKQTALEALARLEAVNPNNPSLPTLRQSAESLP
jgi:tetratricopeptide (TPR) repeat protein